MSDLITPEDVSIAGRAFATVVALLLGLAILFWPGPLAPTDRIPVSLVFLLPGIAGAVHLRPHFAN